MVKVVLALLLLGFLFFFHLKVVIKSKICNLKLKKIDLFVLLFLGLIFCILLREELRG
jgi:hypothetical protein